MNYKNEYDHYWSQEDRFGEKSFESEDENSKSNIIHRYNDKLGYKPIDLIKETNPIVIIDEPQSVDNTDKAKEAIAAWFSEVQEYKEVPKAASETGH